MSDFSFSSTAECELCGAYLSASDEECDHNGMPVETFVFRRLEGGRETITGVECTRSMVWEKLEEKVGDDWIAYQLLGTRDRVNSFLSDDRWDDISDIPRISMAVGLSR